MRISDGSSDVCSSDLDVVAAEIEQHEVFGEVLRVAQQILGKRAVLGRRGAARARAGDRADGDRVVAQAHQDLWTGADDGEAAQVDEEEEGRGVQPAQRAIEREGRQPERQRQALRQHDLKDVAGQDVLLGLRSEEHTSELQSLMRISYAVFCLKKKKQ